MTVRKTHKVLEYRFILASFATLVFCAIVFLQFTPFHSDGDNYFHAFLNDTYVGSTSDSETIDRLLIEARRNVAAEAQGTLFAGANLRIESEEVLFGNVDSDRRVRQNMEEVLRNAETDILSPSYTVKINEYIVNLASEEEAVQLLQAAISRYDESGEFKVSLMEDNGRGFSAQTVQIAKKPDEAVTKSITKTPRAGIAFLSDVGDREFDGVVKELDFDDYDLGIVSMNFAENVEISESYMPKSQLTPLDVAIEEVTKEEEKPSEYTIVSGDTLSGISMKLNIPMETLISLNSDKLKDEHSTLHIDDKLIYTVPEPEVSVERIERVYKEEIYEADVIIIPKDDWYTTKTNVIQQPAAGSRNAIKDEYYINDKLVSETVLKEEVLMEAVPMIMEQGTIIPPTYIKPLSGGYVSSGFGRRKSPGGIGSTYHKGVDWATPTGTSVYASSGGTVASAGWGSGYGYVVYINHPDGRQTRYAHLSKILVSAGQSVAQGQLIARSGSTGNSTGPHLHFEILINGSQVDPLNYVPR